ncbi:hypothetical protein PMIT1320_00696 [Prochlorococcus marinus str. MIT 1320]|nr:hypothetical protein PMIT1320_00696 [Prochlorococcus marinus str. MIT 1320]
MTASNDLAVTPLPLALVKLLGIQEQRAVALIFSSSFMQNERICSLGSTKVN